jgi:hypothetical protein
MLDPSTGNNRFSGMMFLRCGPTVQLIAFWLAKSTAKFVDPPFSGLSE